MIIAFPHRPQKHGGPGSFQKRYEQALSEEDWNITYAETGITPDVVMVIGGTKRIFWLWKMKLKGVPIIYRLDGIFWLHRKCNTSIKKYLLSEYRNLSNKFLHTFIADHIVYQSQFVKEWWDRKGWDKKKEYSIIYNGVNLDKFKNNEDSNRPISLVCLEGTIDYSPYAVELLNKISNRLSGIIPIKVYGRFEDPISKEKLNQEIKYFGSISREKVPHVLKRSIYLSLDINPACPNTVIEALASGSPVIAYDTGSLKELVPLGAGEIVPYGSDPWELNFPDVNNLTTAIYKVLENWDIYSSNARKVATSKFSFEKIFSQYLDVINKVVNKEN